MDLREYLFHKRISIKEFSLLVDCSRTYISTIVNNKKIPSKRLAKSIEKLTNGEVTAQSLLSSENKPDEMKRSIKIKTDKPK